MKIFANLKKHVKHLTIRIKGIYFPDIIKRDSGFRCFYCKKPLQLNNFVYEHLNNDRSDNRLENIVLACVSCNNKKPYGMEMEILAKEKLEENMISNFMREKIFKNEDLATEKPTEVEINETNYEITREFLSLRIEVDDYILFSDTLDAIVYICKEKTGHRSQQSARNYIKALTSIVGPFKIIRDENGKKIIVKRYEN